LKEIDLPGSGKSYITFHSWV